MGEQVFLSLSDEEKLEIENETPTYHYIDKFIYDEHAQLNEYRVHRKLKKDVEKAVDTGKYMISFKDAMKIQCELFKRGNSNCAKIAELTPLSRQSLRDKLSFYYSRCPEEDLV